MKLIIVGGDKVAYYLCQLLLAEQRHEITVIENRDAPSQRLADELEVQVYLGDGTKIAVLEAAGCAEADMLIALTGLDEVNLITCQLAKHHFKVKTTVAKINNPKNDQIFHLFGVDKSFSSVGLLADIIDQEIEYTGMRLAFNVPGNTKAIVEFNLHEHANAVGKTLLEYEFPGDAKVVLITRPDGTVLTPTGEVVMEAGDNMLLVVDEKYFEQVWKVLVKGE